MKIKHGVGHRFMAAALLAGWLGASSGGVHAAELEDFARWYFSPGIGAVIYEGNEPVQASGPFDGLILNLRMGYDIDEWWSIEGGLIFAPYLKENDVGITEFMSDIEAEGNVDRLMPGYTIDENGVVRGRISNSREAPGFGNTWMATLYSDLLFHFTRWERLDPYLAGGLGLMIYGDPILKDGDRTTFLMRGGAGVMYHLSDEWAVRGDWRLLLTADKTDFNTQADVGMVWTWGARVPPQFLAVGGPHIDDVLVRRPKPDFELYLHFDYDAAVITTQYYPLLDEVAEALRQRPETDVRIEGHADQLRRSSARYNRRLSQRRAEAVLEYLVERGGISRDRLEAIGYGFERPKVPHDLDAGAPANRRVEIYLSPAAMASAPR